MRNEEETDNDQKSSNENLAKLNENNNNPQPSTTPNSNSRNMFFRFKTKICALIRNNFANKALIFVSICPLIWLFTYLIVDKKALPGEGIYFSLIALVASAHIIGFIFEKLKMPSLFGMLIVGIAFRNIPVVSVIGKSIDPSTSSILRNISFCVILCRAGLSLNLDILKQLKWIIMKLSIIPSIVEAIGFGIVSHFILKMPLLWTILIGFVVSGVSPAVVVPMMLNAQDLGLGVTKNIPILIIAASCIDNIVAITGHSLVIGLVFDSGQLWWTLIQCPIQICAGIVFGLIAGFFMAIFQIDHSIKLTTLRFISLLLISLVALLGSKRIAFSTSGPLAVLTLTVVANIIWETLDLAKSTKISDLDKNGLALKNKIAVEKMFGQIWSIIFLPLLFTLIGNEVDFAKINPNTLCLGAFCIFIALILRCLATYFSATRAKLNFKEKLFISFSWIPKATVQAAVGSIALDMARERNNSYEIELASNALNIAVLSIILTAPLGTLLISIFAPKFLKNNKTQEIELATQNS